MHSSMDLYIYIHVYELEHGSIYTQVYALQHGPIYKRPCTSVSAGPSLISHTVSVDVKHHERTVSALFWGGGGKVQLVK